MEMPSITRMRTRISLKTLMLLVLCLCCLLGGYRFGYDRGNDAGYAKAIDAKRQKEIYVQAYYVGDLVPQYPLGSLESHITMWAPRESWDTYGGPGSIAGFATNDSIVVSQTGENHDRISARLEALRKRTSPPPTKVVQSATASNSGP